VAERSFEIRTEPHRVNIGALTLLFQPEAVGAEFLGRYEDLQAAQKLIGSPEDASIEAIQGVTTALTGFIRHFLLPESVEAFEGAVLPTRVLVGVVEFLAEIYGGGSEERPTTRSGASPRRR